MCGLKVKLLCLEGKWFSSLLYQVSYEETNSQKGEKLPNTLWNFFIASQTASERFLKSYLVKFTSQRATEDRKGSVTYSYFNVCNGLIL